jgi:hypothetical protein
MTNSRQAITAMLAGLVVMTGCGRNQSETASLSLAVSAPFTGAIWTTDAGCNQVDANIFAEREAVYLDGGPRNQSSGRLPDGDYWVRVTEPNGAVLGTSAEANVHVASGAIAQCLSVWTLVHSASDGTQGYDRTSNAGGEYKLWLARSSAFAPSESKTDNFKVRSVTPPVSSCIGGMKFYDTNANGCSDDGEPGIAGWHVTIFGGPAGFIGYTTTTDKGGSYSFDGLPEGTYGVCEVIPSGARKWIATTPKAIDGIGVPPADAGKSFGNVCVGDCGGRTLGFWSNKNGQALIDVNDLAGLCALNLRNADNSSFDPTTNAQLRTWLLSGNSVNMAYMLSVQLAAMKLNVLNGIAKGETLIYAPGVNGANVAGFMSLSNLIEAANQALTDPMPSRSSQENIKNALDAGNNNLTCVLRPTLDGYGHPVVPCDVSYAGDEQSCAPTAD